MVIIAGLDLSGSDKRPSGIAVIKDNSFIFIGKLYRNTEIINTIIAYKPVIVAIDSPLSFAERYREVDLLMKKLGYRVLPPGWRSMRMLIQRSFLLKTELEKYGIRVIETHPLSALKSSGCRTLNDLLVKLNFKINLENLSKDEKDAVIAAIVAKFFYEKKSCIIKARDGVIHLLPKICK